MTDSSPDLATITPSTLAQAACVCPEPTAELLDAEKRSGRLWQWVAASFCVLFGVALIFNQELACSGIWFWYAVLHHAGKRLYADLHMVQQPFFVLETEAWMSLAGKNWMLFRIPALLHLLALTAGIFLLSTQSRLRDIEKGLLIAFGFFVGINFECYSFGDYHVVIGACLLFSMLLLLKLDPDGAAKRNLKIAAALGLLSGLAITDRSTDGMALFCCVAFAIFCMAKVGRPALLAAFIGVASLVVAGIIGVTGDTYHAWLANSLFRAAGAKGGAESVLLRPFLMPWISLLELAKDSWYGPLIGPRMFLVYRSLGVVAIWTLLIRPFSKADPNSTIKAVVGFALIAGVLIWRGLIGSWAIELLIDLLIVGYYGLALFVLYTLRRGFLRPGRKPATNQRQVLLLLPFGYLLAGSLSSGGYPRGLCGPIAFLFLLLPIVFPAVFERGWFKSSFLVLAGLMTISGIASKVRDPISWHDYRTFPMFSHRRTVQHPVYGLMIMDDALYAFSDEMCSSITAGGKGDLLSIPFPFVNYYCDIPPWQNYVQTFFDTSQEATIQEMTAKLRQSPPKWVLYQRQPEILALHERVYNRGKRLPHRDLDDFLVSKIVSGEWQVVRDVRYGGRSEWMLLKTY